jgi:hypothetical protein
MNCYLSPRFTHSVDPYFSQKVSLSDPVKPGIFDVLGRIVIPMFNPDQPMCGLPGMTKWIHSANGEKPTMSLLRDGVAVGDVKTSVAKVWQTAAPQGD